ncbi:hypothetical protein BP00DRAFT_444538 [Aspergillus indologenus CBS 114.80]|uniref:Zn(2)-C6 fungal-type domain-containing protein n=1 Tax=Aspergillus indologenus CBS 114.80 TaxID=1450541 RepID=A0A2V5IA28_9EURO|nr:hypothetical protein BP00DRAFT_444538 [Aspergillus indologenus CBS 114.80]
MSPTMSLAASQPQQPQPTPSSKAPLTRQACNRCHASKLKCLRPPGVTTTKACIRCIKADAECVYDPPQRFGRPRQKSRPQPESGPPRIEAREPEGTDPRRARHGSTIGTRWESSERESSGSLAPSSAAESPYTAAGSPDNRSSTAVAAAPLAEMDYASSHFPEPLDSERTSELLDAFQSESMQLDVDSYWGEPGPVMPPAETVPYSDLLTGPIDLDFTVSDQDHRAEIHKHAPDPALAVAETESTADDYVLDLVQLQASVNQNNRELAAMIRKAQSALGVSEGRVGQALPIPDSQFKTHLQRNLKASEQTLDVLHRINSQFAPGLRETRPPSRSYGLDPTLDRLYADCVSQDHSFGVGGDQLGLRATTPPGVSAADPQHSILALLVLTTYLRLLHNFDALISILQDRLRCSASLDPRRPLHLSEDSAASDSSSNPLLDVSLGSFSFSSSSARSLQAMLNVQMINTVLTKIKSSTQRMLLGPDYLPPSSCSSSASTASTASTTSGSTRAPPTSANGGPHHPASAGSIFFHHAHSHSHSSSDHPFPQPEGRGYAPYNHAFHPPPPSRHTHNYPTPETITPPSSVLGGGAGTTPPPFVSGVDHVVRRALAEVQELELSLRNRARAIQQWSEEGF